MALTHGRAYGMQMALPLGDTAGQGARFVGKPDRCRPHLSPTEHYSQPAALCLNLKAVYVSELASLTRWHCV